MIHKNFYNAQNAGFNLPETSSFSDDIEWALLFFDLDEHPIQYDGKTQDFVSLKSFDGAYLDSLHAYDLDPIGSVQLDTFEVSLEDLHSDFNFKIMRLIHSSMAENPDDVGKGALNVDLQRWRTMDPKELRNKRVKPGKTIEASFAFLMDEQWFTMKMHFYIKPWRDASFIPKIGNDHIEVLYPISLDLRLKEQQPFWSKPEGKDFYLKTVSFFYEYLSQQFAKYYQWHLYVREKPNSIGFKIPIAPESLPEVFELRDVPLMGRKKALCHFVKSHFRKTPTLSEYDEPKRQVFVNQYLRGETKFNWNGLELHILPARYDLNRVKTRKKFLEV